MQYATGVSNLGRVFKIGAGSAVFLNALKNTTRSVSGAVAKHHEVLVVLLLIVWYRYRIHRDAARVVIPGAND